MAALGPLLRALLLVAGAAAGLLVARDAPNFGVVQGMLALVVAAAVLLAIGLAGRR